MLEYIHAVHCFDQGDTSSEAFLSGFREHSPSEWGVSDGTVVSKIRLATSFFRSNSGIPRVLTRRKEKRKRVNEC